jgi:ribosomal protein S18 acetylase RimI-like enzyme
VSISAATKGHVRSMARLHSICFPSRFVKHMGRGYLLAMYRPYVMDPSGMAFVATSSNGEVVGLLTGGSRDIERQFARSVPKRFAVQLIWGFLVNRVVRQVVWERLSSALRARGGRNWRRSDAVLPPETAWLHVICIHPNTRGSGVADRLFDAFIDECATRGYVRAALKASEKNYRAIRCYEKNGWYVSSSDGTDVQMEREVPPASAQARRHVSGQDTSPKVD